MSLDKSGAHTTRRLHLQSLVALTSVALGGTWAPSAQAAESQVQGAGASFPSKVYGRWMKQYAEGQSVSLSYKATGSGDGVKQAIARTAQLAGTDAPLSEADLAKHKLVQLPMLVGGVVPVVNLPGVENKRLRLTGEVLALVQQGEITRWDDARIAELNRGLTLPAKRIIRVVRADKSGTTEGYTRYLSEVSATFKTAVGVNGLPKWPGEVERAEGNDGVASLVKSTSGSIGYVSHDRIETDGLASVTLRNRDGQWVSSSEAGFRSAILNSDLHRSGVDTASLMNRAGSESWPITLTSFLLIDATPANAAAAESTMKFLYWCFMRGDALTRGTGFAPLPTSVQARLTSRLTAVKPRDGSVPVYQSF